MGGLQSQKEAIVNPMTIKSANMRTRIAERKANNINSHQKATVTMNTIKSVNMQTKIAEQKVNKYCLFGVN